ncbi:MAG: ParB/RepB/Spo0J family partition protein [Gemmatimonadaceae bacterium]
MTADKPRRLGRGLEALLSAAPNHVPSASAELRRISLSEIRPNPYQPRKEFRPEELADLEASLKINGLLQPITVRPAPAGRGFELIAGERRLRAATHLGWSEVPALVRPIDDRMLLTLALVENLQRTDLNAIEEAEGYRRLMDEFALTQQEVADVVGKDRSTVANLLRLLALPVPVRQMLQASQLSAGHARALLAAKGEREMLALAQEIVARGLSVRDVERRLRVGHAPRHTPRSAPTATPTADGRSAEVRHVETELCRHLQTDVQVSLSSSDTGVIKVPFYSADDLERLLDTMLGAGREAL